MHLLAGFAVRAGASQSGEGLQNQSLAVEIERQRVGRLAAISFPQPGERGKPTLADQPRGRFFVFPGPVPASLSADRAADIIEQKLVKQLEACLSGRRLQLVR